jgi:hypothetical protein
MIQPPRHRFRPTGSRSPAGRVDAPTEARQNLNNGDTRDVRARPASSVRPDAARPSFGDEKRQDQVSPDDVYKVGPGKPPKHSQQKAGARSINPYGRRGKPKTGNSIGEIIQRVGAEPRDHRPRKEVSRTENLIRAAFAHATKSGPLALALLKEIDRHQPRSPSNRPLTPEEENELSTLLGLRPRISQTVPDSDDEHH